MNRRSTLMRTLAIIGTILVWSPIAFMVLTSAIGSARSGIFRMDYLLPAELFPLILVGSGLLVWAAWLAHRRKRIIGGGIVVAVGSIVLGQALAVVTGLASGATEPTGWQWGLVLAAIAVFIGAVIAIGVGGILLTRDLYALDSENAV